MRNNDFWNNLNDENHSRFKIKRERICTNILGKIGRFFKSIGELIINEFDLQITLFTAGFVLLVVVILGICTYPSSSMWSKNVDGVKYKYVDGSYYAVSAKDGLESVTVKSKIGKKDIKGIANGAFAGNTDLKEVVIEDGIEYIGYGDIETSEGGVFSGCTSLSTVTIPTSVKNIDDYAFYCCTSLTEITIANNSSVWINDYAFAGCTNLTAFTSMNGAIIYEHAFSGCTRLTKLSFGDGVSALYPYSLEGCTSLTELTFNNEYVTIYDYALTGCTALTTLNVHNGITTHENSFLNCPALSEINVTVSKDYLSGINELQNHSEISEFNFTIENGTTVLASFAGCTALKSIIIPDTVVEMFPYTFLDCTALESLIIPNGVKVIGNETFRNCTSLKSITLPEGLETIDSFAFSGCTSLTEIIIPDGVKSIGYSAFYVCSQLAVISLPESLEMIDSLAFGDCTALIEVYYAGTMDEWELIEGFHEITVPIICTDGIYEINY